MRKIRKIALLRPKGNLDSVGVLRVGGRLKHSDLSSEVKEPNFLPKKEHVMNLVISHYHDSVEHPPDSGSLVGAPLYLASFQNA